MDPFDFIHPTPAAWLRDGALAPFVPAYWRYLTERKYAARTARSYLCGLAHFARWSRRRRLVLGDLDPKIEQFLDQHLPKCCCPTPVQRGRHEVRAALRHLEPVLREAGIGPIARRADPTDVMLRRFDDHLQYDQGLALNTRVRRRLVVGALMRKIGSVSPSANQLRDFISGELTRVSAGSGASIATSLRSYLRFRALDGERVEHLLPAIASPAHWRLAPLPQTLSRDEVTRLLDAFPPDLPSRRRCYAMVRCVVDLGLRSSEVVNLELGDIDWTAGSLRVVKCKSRRADILPLPHATGQAIAEYLRWERPETAHRKVFVRHVAPVDEPVSAGVVRRTVRESYRRAGLPYTSVHILRHTLASRLLNTGGTLKEVADVLRHRELNTSLIYAKVDEGRLAAVAMPWPGSEQ